MSVRYNAQFTYQNPVVNNNDAYGGQQVVQDVYITLYDLNTGALVPSSGPGSGNGLTVYYTETDQSGNVTAASVQITGNSQMIGTFQTSSVSYDAGLNTLYSYFLNFNIARIDTTTQGNAVGQFNDLRILSTSVSNVSASGASDGKVTILGASSHLPLLFSLDGQNYQSPNVFTGLTPGTYTAYIQDSAGNKVSAPFQVVTVSAVLISDPSKSLDGVNVSRWNAAFNPIVFQYQRQDFQIASVTSAASGAQIGVNLQTNFIGVLPKTGEVIYISAGPYLGLYVIAANTQSQITIQTPFLGNATGYVNVNSERLYYKVYTQIKYIDPDTGLFVTQQMTSSPNSTGLSICDLSGLIRAILKPKDLFLYNQANYCDPYQSVSYQVSYKESWNGNAGSFVVISAPYYAVYAAFQIQEPGCDNMAPYVPFANETVQALKAGWLSDFQMPVLFSGQPFDLSFIYSESLAGLSLNVAVTYLDINKNAIGTAITSSLLNENGSFLLNQDLSKLLISRNLVAGGNNLAQQIGLNRLNLTATYPANVYYLDVVINYVNQSGATVEVTQHVTVKISDQCTDYPVYLKWVGKHGGWNYYQFGYNQDVAVNVQNMQLIKRRVTNYLASTSQEDVVSKIANRKITVYAEDVPVADILGVESIYDSPKVMMLQPSGLWQTVIVNTASFKLYDTRDDHAAIKFTIDLPTKNVQNQ